MFVKGIGTVCGEFESVYGKIVSCVSCKNGKINVHIEVPANTKAVVLLPEKDKEQEIGSGIYDFEYDTETSLELDRYSMDSTLGEIISEPLAVEMFNNMAPGMLDNPLIKFAYKMTLSEMLGQAPEARPLYEAVVRELNKQERSKN